jgi:Uma2 family endonuclease
LNIPDKNIDLWKVNRNEINAMTTSTSLRPPRTILEVFNSLPEGTSAQLIESNIVMSPSPLDRHAQILMEVGSTLYRHIKIKKLGAVRVAPYDVHLDDANVFQPDICFISNKNIHIIKAKGCYGSPDLVIEILSPSNAHFDLNTKKEVYERTGVAEYWIIDPKDKSTQGYILKDGKYQSCFKGKSILELNYLKLKIKF